MQHCRILLADDDPDDISILEDAITTIHKHCIVFSVENGQAAMDLLIAQHEKGQLPDLIVLDLNMPRINGSDTLSNIKNDERFKNIPVIIYSTSINPVEKNRCLKLGAQAYMIKPSSLKESIETAKVFLEVCKA